LDNIFRFLRAAEFNLTEYFAVVQLFVNKDGGSANYSLILEGLPRWFRAEQRSSKSLKSRGFRFRYPNASFNQEIRSLALAIVFVRSLLLEMNG